jgi:hypothetical protein
VSEELTNEDCVVIEQIYLEYCAFEMSNGRNAPSRFEWSNSVLRVGDKLGDPNFVKNLIKQYKMKNNCELN